MKTVKEKIRKSGIFSGEPFLKNRNNLIRILQAFLTFFILNSIAFADIDDEKSNLSDLFFQIPDAIDRIEGDRCFLKLEKLEFVDGAVYVRDERGNLTTLPMICFTQSGAFTLTGSSPRPSSIWICHTCGWRHDYQPTICERANCGSRDFIVRYR